MDCPLCGTDNDAAFRVHTQEARASSTREALRCSTCGLIYLKDYRRDRSHLYRGDYAVWGAEGDDVVASSKRETFREQLGALADVEPPAGRTLLDVGTGSGYLLDAAAGLGYDAHGIEPAASAAARAERRHPGKVIAGTLGDDTYPERSFDAMAMTDVIEHVADPRALLRSAAKTLKDGGLLLVVTPDTDSWTRRLLGPRWFQYKDEHVTYWNRRTLARALGEAGFETVLARRNVKRFSLAYYRHYFGSYSVPFVRGPFMAAYGLLPERLRRASFPNACTGELLLVARRKPRTT
jgi:2-polyprenyl-3-methyl-5-hydroxy-6-metoxy-1,4-benzoquinol methylase